MAIATAPGREAEEAAGYGEAEDAVVCGEAGLALR